jgi:hypothetical protein
VKVLDGQSAMDSGEGPGVGHSPGNCHSLQLVAVEAQGSTRGWVQGCVREVRRYNMQLPVKEWVRGLAHH